MASFGEGFTSGMGQGMAMGKLLLDTYNEYDQKDKLKKAGELSPEEVAGGFTPNQQTTLDYINDPNNGYEVKKLDNGNVQFRTAGSENSWQDLEQGVKKWKLGDKTYDTKPTDDMVSRSRANAIADVYMQNGDPAKAYGLKALAREDRTGTQIEDLKDWRADMYKRIASGDHDGVINELMPYYNKPTPGTKLDDKHFAVRDPRSNSIVFSNESGTPVNQLPITGQNLTSAVDQIFETRMGGIDLKYGLDSRKTKSEERKAGAAEKTADATYEHYRPGGTAERIAGMSLAARTGGGGLSGKAFDAKVNTLAQNAVDAGATGPDGKPLTLAQAKHHVGQMLMKDPEAAAPRVNADGSITQGNAVYVPDPNNPGKYIQAQLPNAAGSQNPLVAAFANADPSKLNKPTAQGAAKPEASLGMGQALRIRGQGVEPEIKRTAAALEQARRDAAASDTPEEWGSTISTYEKQLAALEAIKNKKGK